MNLRKDKTCLNCGYPVEEKFCSRCGQKNVELHMSVWKTLVHFIGDYFHADGKFFKSIVPLVFRPGYLTNEFAAGHRAKYIDPFRLYIFISILFFIFYTDSNIRDIKEAALERKKINRDTTASHIVRRESSQGLNIRLDTVNAGDVTGEFSFSIPENLPETVQEYLDSVSRLPEADKPGWLENKLYLKTIRQANMSDESILSGWLSSFFHNIPKMMFILLPFAAMFLKLLYIRRKKYYIDHLIFVLHTHSWLFLILLVPYLLEYTGIISESPILILMMLFYIYLFLAMKNVYRQNILKTALKFLLFLGLYTFSFLVIIVVNLILTTAVI